MLGHLPRIAGTISMKCLFRGRFATMCLLAFARLIPVRLQLGPTSDAIADPNRVGFLLNGSQRKRQIDSRTLPFARYAYFFGTVLTSMTIPINFV